MRTYIVDRVSLHDRYIKPCEDAYRMMLTSLCSCEFSSMSEVYRLADPSNPVEYIRRAAQQFLDSGTNHRDEDGHVVCDMDPEEYWVVDVDDIDAFVDREGNVIIWQDDKFHWMVKENLKRMSIYDDYIE